MSQHDIGKARSNSRTVSGSTVRTVSNASHASHATNVSHATDLSRRVSNASLISNVERDSLEEVNDKLKYKQIAKKLAQDKVKLKDKLRNLLNEVEDKMKEYHNKTEKFEAQINELSKEKTQAQEQLKKIQSSIIDEKESIRKKYEDKLKKSGKDSTVVSRLENTITTLQERLDKQSEERENLKDTTERFYTSRESQLKTQIKELEGQLTKYKDILNSEHKELQNISKTFQNEKEQLVFQFRKEKEDELKQILMDKNTVISSLQGIKEQTEKRMKIFEKEKEEEIAKLRLEIEKLQTEGFQRERDSSSSFRKKIDELKHEYEGQLFEKDRTNKITLENVRNELEKKMDGVHLEKERKLETLSRSFQRDLEELKKTNLSLQEKNTELESLLTQESSKKEIFLEKRYNKAIETLKIEHNALLQTSEKAMEALKLRDEKIIGEMEENNQRLKEQINTLSNNMKKLQENSQTLSLQFIQNLNQQKEMSEKEIFEKEQTISELKRHLNNLGTESLDKINTLERKVKNLSDDLSESTNKNNNFKNNIEKLEQNILFFKNELAKSKEVLDKTNEKTRLALLEKESWEKKYSNLDIDLKNKDSDNIKLRAELTRFLRLENNTKEEWQKIAKDNDVLSLEIEKKKKEIDFLNLSLNSSREEYTRMKTDLNETYRTKLAGVYSEKDKIIAELNSKISSLETSLKNLDANKETLRMILLNVTNEKEKLKNETERLNQELERNIKISQDNQREIISLKNNYLTCSKENSLKDSELNDLRQKVKTIEGKDAQISEIKANFNATQLNYKHTIDSLTTDYKKDKEELKMMREKMVNYNQLAEEVQTLRSSVISLQENIKIAVMKTEDSYKKELGKSSIKLSEAEFKITQADQKLEIAKLEFLKKLNEAKQLPPEKQSEFDCMKKENQELKLKLEMTINSLDKLRGDYARESAEMKSRESSLTQKEEELRKESERIKNLPPKLLDPMFKKGRDDALAQLRQAKLDANKLKEEILEKTEKLYITEGLVKDLEKEKEFILKSQTDVKETFVTSLNQQTQKHNKELEKKDQRIRELENILTEKMKTVSTRL